jgi:hypothetical protein
MEIESNIDIVSNELESFTITRVEAKNPKWIALSVTPPSFAADLGERELHGHRTTL